MASKREKKDEGPRGWMVEQRKATYARLTRRGEEGNESPLAMSIATEEAIHVEPELWIDRLAEYKRRKVAVVPADVSIAAAAEAMPGPMVPGEKNWAPLGPTVLMNGQAIGDPPVGGRIAGIAVARNGLLVYAASANGGVFRSDDGGVSWRSLMDSFDVDPLNFASTSLASGAIAIDLADPERIYVGTGEGDTHGMFERRIVHALPAYRGIGPIRSDDGGRTWIRERTAQGSPTLAGAAFYALAVDPANREHVIAATTEGIYERVFGADDEPEWVQREAGIYASVIATTIGGATRFYASETEGGVSFSDDGTTWTAAGNGFPDQDVGRIALAAQPVDPSLIYAFVADANGGLHGVYRLSLDTNEWTQLTNPPNVLAGRQGEYDLTVAVDPQDENLLYLGGDRLDTSPFPGSIWRCTIGNDGSIAGVSIGQNAHADVHVLVHTPGDSNSLWTGTDGGVFLNRDPRGSGVFQSRNTGLSCLCPNFIGQHATDPAVMFCGLQDNGTGRTVGGGVWRRVSGGDGGYCLVNWNDGRQILVSMNGRVLRSTNDGASFSQHNFGFRLMTYPIAGLPRNPAKKSEAKVAAVGVVDTVFLTTNFGISWTPVVAIPGGEMYSLVFATPTRMFAGMTNGDVFRIDRAANGMWAATRIDDAAAGPIDVRGPVSDIAVDWSDPARNSVYAAFGGSGDPRHVWHWNGTAWESRSGTPGADLLDVEHNAITVDPLLPDRIYVGADIGVWHSADAGTTWVPLPNALPDAPVFDLQIHPSRRLLRAATHGRGIYEWEL